MSWTTGLLKKKVKGLGGDVLVPVVPAAARATVLFHAHDHACAGHLAFAKTWARLRNKYYWPKIAQDVKNYVASCKTCAETNISRQAPAGMLIPIKPTTRPFERIGIDKVGPIHATSRGNKYIFMVTDYCTKMVFAEAAKEGNALSAVKIMRRVIDLFGPPLEDHHGQRL